MVRYKDYAVQQNLWAQRHSQRVKLQNSYNRTTMAPLHSGWSNSQTAFFAPSLVNWPIEFSFKCVGMVVHWFKAWHDRRLHPTLRANEQLPCIDYLLKWAQIGCLRVGCLPEHFWIHNPVDMTSHWLYLNQNGIGSVPDYLSVRQKVACEQA